MIKMDDWYAGAQAGGQGRGCVMHQRVVIADPRTNVYIGATVGGKIFITTFKCQL